MLIWKTFIYTLLVPPRPVNLTATALSSTEINVEWSPVNVTIDGDLTVIGYTVFYRRILDNETMWNRIATEVCFYFSLSIRKKITSWRLSLILYRKIRAYVWNPFVKISWQFLTWFSCDFSTRIFTNFYYCELKKENSHRKFSRSSHRRCPVKKGVLENMANFTGVSF